MKTVVVRLRINFNNLVGDNLGLFFKISLFFFLISSVFAVDLEKKSLLKSLLSKKYHYYSSIPRSEYLLGEEIVLSNRVSKGKYSVAGKPIFFVITDYTPAESSLLSFIPTDSVGEFRGVIKTSNIKGQDKFTNLVESLSVHLLSNSLVTARTIESNVNISTLTEPSLTNPYGQANFILVPSVAGSYTLAVYFLHSKDLYVEHVNLLKFKVVNPSEAYLNFIYSLTIPFGLLFLGIFGMIIYRWWKKPRVNQMEGGVFSNRLLSYTSMVLEQFYFSPLREVVSTDEAREMPVSITVKNTLVMTLVHMSFFTFMVGLLLCTSYWYGLALFFLVLVRSKLTWFYSLLSILLLLMNLSIGFYAKNTFIILPLTEYYYKIVFFMVVISFLFPFPPFFFALATLAWIQIPKSELFELLWLFPIITTGLFFTMIFLNWYLKKRIH